jgi:hypothetical protein
MPQPFAIAHPLGASGARSITTALHRLQRVQGRYALCTMCIVVGQGIALIIERVWSGTSDLVHRDRWGLNQRFRLRSLVKIASMRCLRVLLRCRAAVLIAEIFPVFVSSRYFQ